jgi:catechol 2,3-dioxygenase-like lactoylglutathione lyase family enzyme
MKQIEADIASALAYKNVHQLGFVVEDMGRALDNFAEKLGIRKWYRPVFSEKDESPIFYKGAKIDSQLGIAVGYLGRLQIELVTTKGDRNIYLDHLERHGEGMHHICFFVSDLDRKLGAYKKLGIEPVQAGAIVSKGGAVTRYAYLDSALTNGLIVELTETRRFGLPMKMSPFLMKVGKMTGDLSVVEW